MNSSETQSPFESRIAGRRRLNDAIKLAMIRWRIHNSAREEPTKRFKPRFSNLVQENQVVDSGQRIMDSNPVRDSEQAASVAPQQFEDCESPEDFQQEDDTGMLTPERLKQEVETPPASPFMRDHFLFPHSDDDANEIAESQNQLHSVPISTLLGEESCENGPNTIVFHYDVEAPDDRSSSTDQQQNEQFRQTAPPLLQTSSFICRSDAEARAQAIGHAAAQKEINDFGALITLGMFHRSMSNTSSCDTSSTNSMNNSNPNPEYPQTQSTLFQEI
ncbi:unnamed protein product [Orchesella dallaii]|uniref:Uncharacterized protein n=1 Tax=Orchesella dallaii TaxID=48710 RepID=A0ABP1Q6F2_9HEXA